MITKVVENAELLSVLRCTKCNRLGTLKDNRRLPTHRQKVICTEPTCSKPSQGGQLVLAVVNARSAIEKLSENTGDKQKADNTVEDGPELIEMFQSAARRDDQGKLDIIKTYVRLHKRSQESLNRAHDETKSLQSEVDYLKAELRTIDHKTWS